MAKWTEERRKKQAEAIKRWKPWEKSTGPKTKEGKTRASMNAYKHGRRSLFTEETRELLKLNKAFISVYMQMALANHDLLCETNELIKRKLNQGPPPTPWAETPERTDTT